jgi:hypothetical protein
MLGRLRVHNDYVSASKGPGALKYAPELCGPFLEHISCGRITPDRFRLSNEPVLPKELLSALTSCEFKGSICETTPFWPAQLRRPRTCARPRVVNDIDSDCECTR